MPEQPRILSVSIYSDDGESVTLYPSASETGAGVMKIIWDKNGYFHWGVEEDQDA